MADQISSHLHNKSGHPISNSVAALQRSRTGFTLPETLRFWSATTLPPSRRPTENLGPGLSLLSGPLFFALERAKNSAQRYFRLRASPAGLRFGLSQIDRTDDAALPRSFFLLLVLPHPSGLGGYATGRPLFFSAPYR